MLRPISAPGRIKGGRIRANRVLTAASVVVVLALAFVTVLVVRAVRRASPPVARAVSSAAPPSATEPAPAGVVLPEIHGRVLDAEGKTVAGAIVRLVSAGPPYTVYGEARSDEFGVFSFARVGPWRVRVVAEHAPDGVVTSALLHTSAGRTTEVTLVLSAAGAVHGTVADTQGRPVTGAVLSVEGVPWIVPATTSDDAGAFRLTTVPDEATSIVAVARGYKSARSPLGPRAGQDERTVRVTLTRADKVLGDARDDGNNPVRARIVACEHQPAEVRTMSEEDGTFELPASAIGCTAVAEHAEYAPSEAQEVVAERRLVLRLKAGGSIEGTVVSDRGESVRSFTLGIESSSPARGWRFDHGGPRSFDDVHGSFRWDRLAPGTYVLTAAGDGRPPARSSSIEVHLGAVTRGVRVVLPSGGTLTGMISDEAHTPLAGVDVRFDQVSSVVPSDAATQTDVHGMYRLAGAPAGPLSLLVRKEGFRTKLVSGVRVDSSATRRQDVMLTALDGGSNLELGGIGAALTRAGPGILLGEVYAGDPAARAGLRSGDLILRVDGENVGDLSMADVLQRLRGEPGTSVGVSVLRPETGESVELTIVRGRIIR